VSLYSLLAPAGIEGMQKLDEKTQQELFNIIDTYLRDSKARQAHSV